MKKSVYTLLLCVCILMCGALQNSMPVVWAGEMEEETQVQPRLVYIASIRPNLTISNGTASISCRATGDASVVTSMHLEADLEQYKDGKWQSYKRYAVISHSSSASINRSVSVEKGYTYRLKGTAYAYVTTLAENGTAYSAQVRY